ncbi:hypothetical protein ABL78_6006 [Leptomonas seymouri]|uniref:Uncharacterized protein n=1 Tax=Leptomonas seymouri TaxID=5684 RepID=A0A0N0P466_LEPSE|nr:hypothetical protein ABL78_6006 [Leptomonas seymouri]|eukprot:KPI84939.1 hypothetical protein ABL78_6006 [Leptomonas seymouri]
MSDVWRCEKCKRAKALTGPHLNGKSRVRSDCWPCGRKTTFVKDSADPKTAATAIPLPASLSVTPSNEAQAAAFQNIFVAATAAAAAAKTTAAATVTAKSPVFPFPATTRGSNANSNSGISSSNAVTTRFGTSGVLCNPTLNPVVSPASIKAFQNNYASATTAKYEGPAPASANINPSIPATSNRTTPGTAFSSAHATPPYVMESAAGTSPPFTFRLNANYIPSASAGGPSAAQAPLTGSTAAATTRTSGCALAPVSSSPADASNLLATHVKAKPLPSTAGAAPGAVASAVGSDARSAAEPSSTGTWTCMCCHKVKDLKGDHLRGKTTVRSDCWPCAKKQTFILTASGAVAAASASSHTRSVASAATPANASTVASSVSSNPFIALQMPAAPSRASTAATTTTSSACAVAPTGNPFLRSSSTPKPLPWVLPTIPPSTSTEESYLLHPGSADVASTAPPIANTAATTHNMSSATPAASSAPWIAAAIASTGGTEADVVTPYAAMARFDQQLLKSFRERLVGGTHLRAVWFDRVLYVITEDTLADAAATDFSTLSGEARQKPNDVAGAFGVLGRFAALFLAVEQKLASSRFRHIGRLFSPNEFAFAAACCYAGNFFAAEAAAAGTAASKFTVYGPKPDPTKLPSLWGRIVSGSPFAHCCVVSEDQRVAAAQTLYRRVSWLAAPQTMTATAIQLSVEAESTADVHGVDVVLLTSTMKLEELPQAVPLAQLPRSYA